MEQVVAQEQRGKKRVRNELNWQRKIRKTNKALGNN